MDTDTSPTANNNWLTKSPASKSRRQHSCTRCRHHGMVEVRVLNHQCPYKSCTCSSCVLVKQRALMYRSKNSSKNGIRDAEEDLSNGSEQLSPVGINVGNYGSGTLDPARNPRHHLLRASPAAVDSPTTRSSMGCSSPWDSKSSSGSSYSSSTPGLEWQQQQHLIQHQNHNQFQNSQPHTLQHPTFQIPVSPTSQLSSIDGKISDFRSLCMTFPDYSVSQLQAIFEQSGSDFQRTIDTILMRRWSDESYSNKPGISSDYNNQLSEPSFNTGSYLNPHERITPGSSVSQSPLAQNGYSGFSGNHYSNNGVAPSTMVPNFGHAAQPQYLNNQTIQPQQNYPPPHLYGPSSSYSLSSNGNTPNFYDPSAAAPTAAPTYLSSQMSPSMSNHIVHRQPFNGGMNMMGKYSGPAPMSNGNNSSSYVVSQPHSIVGRTDQGITYHDLSGTVTPPGPRSFSATIVSQSQPSMQPSLTETMLSQIGTPDGRDGYQSLIADDPLPLNEAMAVPIKRKRGRPKKVPGSPPVKRTIKKSAASCSPSNEDSTISTTAIFKVPQSVDFTDSSVFVQGPPSAASMSPTTLPEQYQVNGREEGAQDAERQNQELWPSPSPSSSPQSNSPMLSSDSNCGLNHSSFQGSQQLPSIGNLNEQLVMKNNINTASEQLTLESSLNCESNDFAKSNYPSRNSCSPNEKNGSEMILPRTLLQVDKSMDEVSPWRRPITSVQLPYSPPSLAPSPATSYV